jgi:uncharacterized membrane protein YqjE
VSDGAPGGPSRGLRGALKALGGALLGLVHTRLSLASVEFDEALDRILERLIYVLVAVFCFAFAALGASALVVVAFWESNRIGAICGVILAYALVGVIALWRLSQRARSDGPMFAETIAQFERDRSWLGDKPGDGP